MDVGRDRQVFRQLQAVEKLAGNLGVQLVLRVGEEEDREVAATGAGPAGTAGGEAALVRLSEPDGDDTIGPLAMLYFLLRATGIPLTEAQALKSRGEAYRRYQQTTSRFFPWFPGKPAS